MASQAPSQDPAVQALWYTIYGAPAGVTPQSPVLSNVAPPLVVNGLVGYGGILLDLQLAGVSVMSLSAGGTLVLGGSTGGQLNFGSRMMASGGGYYSGNPNGRWDATGAAGTHVWTVNNLGTTVMTLSNTGQLSPIGQIYPATPALAAQAAAGLFAGTGVPSNANGNNGDFYFRSDGGAGTSIYQKRAGAWVATAA